MPRDDDTPSESEVTTDPDRIETWADEHEATPVRRESGGEDTVEILPESDRREHHEEMTWDDFHREIDENEMVVIRRNRDSRPFDVLARNEMVSRLDAEDVEQRLMAGETVTSTITETTVIEETIVEEATVESEVVDRAVVEESIVDAELVSREVDHCEVTAVDIDDEMVDDELFETGYESTGDDIEVTVEVDEDWAVTREVLEQLTIESRIVDTDATETETVETDSIEERVDIEGVQETILEGDMLASGGRANEVIESGAIESEFREGEVVETTLLERKTVEEELRVRREYTGDLTTGSTLSAETISSRDVETEIATDEDREFLDREAMADTGTTGTIGGSETMADTEMADDDMTADDMETTADPEATAGTEPPTATADADAGEHRVMPTEADEGKMVVDATGEEVGMVTDVEGGTMYVDAHPSLTDRIKSVLDWGGHDDDAYPLEPENIASITDDEVQLAGEEDLERA
ncbi:hypothetical protein OB920_14695 [Halobacteria archaeon HArc-gm2]|nr:hypothetical protein [Halobacteria archaeon HArc-gm2]